METILNQAKSSLGNLTKIDAIVEALEATEEKLNMKFLEETLSKLQGRQETIANIISKHQETIAERIDDIRSDIFVQSTNVGKLAHIQLKDREKDAQLGLERETWTKKSFDAMQQQNADLQRALNRETLKSSFICSFEVLLLILPFICSFVAHFAIYLLFCCSFSYDFFSFLTFVYC